MKTPFRFSLGICLLAACAQDPVAPPSAASDGPSLAAQAITDNMVIPTDLLVYVPCANGGAGENVAFSGNLHVLTHLTISNAGTATIKSHFQPQGMTGLGQVTGDEYHATGVTQDILHLAMGETYTMVNNFRIIGRGTGNNFLAHETFHYTFNANGTLTVVHDNLSTTCK